MPTPPHLLLPVQTTLPGLIRPWPLPSPELKVLSSSSPFCQVWNWQKLSLSNLLFFFNSHLENMRGPFQLHKEFVFSFKTETTQCATWTAAKGIYLFLWTEAKASNKMYSRSSLCLALRSMCSVLPTWERTWPPARLVFPSNREKALLLWDFTLRGLDQMFLQGPFRPVMYQWFHLFKFPSIKVLEPLGVSFHWSPSHHLFFH